MQYVVIIYTWKILPEMREDNVYCCQNEKRGTVCTILSILSTLKQDKPQNEVDYIAFNILGSATVFHLLGWDFEKIFLHHISMTIL